MSLQDSSKEFYIIVEGIIKDVQKVIKIIQLRQFKPGSVPIIDCFKPKSLVILSFQHSITLVYRNFINPRVFLNNTMMMENIKECFQLQSILSEGIIYLINDYIKVLNYYQVPSCLLNIALHRINPQKYSIGKEENSQLDGNKNIDITVLDDPTKRPNPMIYYNYFSNDYSESEFTENMLIMLMRLWLNASTQGQFSIPKNPSITLLNNFRFLLSIVPFEKVYVQCPLEAAADVLEILALAYLYNHSLKEVTVNRFTYNYEHLQNAANNFFKNTNKFYFQLNIKHEYILNSEIEIIEFPLAGLINIYKKLMSIKIKIQKIEFKEDLAQIVSQVSETQDTLINIKDHIDISKSHDANLLRQFADVVDTLYKFMFIFTIDFKELSGFELNVTHDTFKKFIKIGLMQVDILDYLNQGIMRVKEIEFFENICELCKRYPVELHDIAESIIYPIVIDKFKHDHPFYPIGAECLAYLHGLAAQNEDEQQKADQQCLAALRLYYSLPLKIQIREEGEIYLLYIRLAEIKPNNSGKKVKFETDSPAEYFKGLFKLHVMLSEEKDTSLLPKIRLMMLQHLDCVKKNPSCDSEGFYSSKDYQCSNISLLCKFLDMSIENAKVLWEDIVNIHNLPLYSKLTYTSCTFAELVSEIEEAIILSVDFNANNKHGENILIHFLSENNCKTAKFLIPYLNFNKFLKLTKHSYSFLEFSDKSNVTLFVRLFYPIRNCINWPFINEVLDQMAAKKIPGINLNLKAHGISLLQNAIDALQVTTVEKLLQCGADPTDAIAITNVREYFEKRSNSTLDRNTVNEYETYNEKISKLLSDYKSKWNQREDSVLLL